MKAPGTLERVRVALRRMGFREGEAKQAVARVASLHENVQAIGVELALREALLAATANRS